MASLMGLATLTVTTLFLLLSVDVPTCARAIEFDVGSEEGWIVPRTRDQAAYNHWASQNRFRIGDTIRFRYEKDSVMSVTEGEYEKCRSLHPTFFSNTGDSIFRLDRSGTYYFISGVAGHCERGQKMVVRVLAHAPPPPQGSPSTNSSSQTAGATPSAAASGALVPAVGVVGLLLGSFLSLF